MQSLHNNQKIEFYNEQALERQLSLAKSFHAF